ncbi:MAG: AAA family ATPase [Acidimicrobiales bacterium]|jgi:aminoglycoside phosphotransferase family enzyme/predicted kinase
MLRPERTPSALPPGQAAVVETHISTLFFVGDRVYKLHKPVRFDFLDFREREARRADSEREVMLNRRLAPDVYLGVADVAMGGELLDHLVVMKRMPEERRLTAVASRGDDLGGWLRRVAEVVDSFHRGATRSPGISQAATARAIRDGWEANFLETDRFVGTMLDTADEGELRRRARRFVDGREELFGDRISRGRVCDGHGDLQADDVFCLDDGVRVLDCVEFSDELRYVDVCADVAFLAMDLERLGYADEAARFLLDYQELADDRFPDPLLHHYLAARAYVRAKVCCLQAAQGAPGAASRALEFQRIALDHLRRSAVTLVLVGGLPGSGKSTLASGLGAARGWTVLRSDEIRKETDGAVGERIARDPSGPYGTAATDAVYGALLDRAGRALGRAESVVLDASWIDARRREAASELADRRSSELVELCCVVAPEEADRRIRIRLADGSSESEATPAVRESMGRRMDPWESATVIDTSQGEPAEALAAAEAALSGQ